MPIPVPAPGQPADRETTLYIHELLKAFPRSLRFCLHEVDHALHRLSGAPVGTFATSAERESGRICSSLDFAGAADLAREGTANVAERITASIDELGSAITSAYFPRVPVG